MYETQPGLDNWEDFLGKYFKAEMAKKWPCEVAVVAVNSRYEDEGRAQLVLDVEYQGKRFLFEPNVGNTAFIRKAFPNSPKELVGHKIVFVKVLARNPTTKQMVDSLSIYEIYK